MKRTVFIAFYHKNKEKGYTVNLDIEFMKKISDSNTWIKARKIIQEENEIMYLEEFSEEEKGYIMDDYLDKLETRVGNVARDIENSGIDSAIFIFVPICFIEQKEQLILLVRRSTEYIISWEISFPKELTFEYPLAIKFVGGRSYFGINEYILGGN